MVDKQDGCLHNWLMGMKAKLMLCQQDGSNREVMKAEVDNGTGFST